MRYRALLAMLSCALLSSVGLAQMPSRFDLTGNASLGNLQFAGAPSSSQVRAIGFQRKEVPVPATVSSVTIVLQEDPFKLEAVVVTGQATTLERRNATTA